MNYEETISYLFSLLPMYQRVGKAAYKKDLSNTLALDDYFGHPHRAFKTIHVAGTNGKGSVSHYIASVLQEAGYKTGLYTSPHLKDYRERIKINGVEIEKDFVTDFVRSALPAIEKIRPSFFELTVLMAFVYFKEKQVDIAVIETGMGGRLDSTNIIHPLLSVITYIDWDHAEFLGNTLEKIAAEKAGIIKKGIPVITGEWKEEPLEVLKTTAQSKKADLIVAPQQYRIDYLMETPDGFLSVNVKDRKGKTVYAGLKSSLTGYYQPKNIITSLVSLETLQRRGIGIGTDAIRKGFEKVVTNTGIKGRWQIIRHRPEIILDMAHNEDAIRQVIQAVQKLPYKTLRIVTGYVNDKHLHKIIALLPADALYYVTQASIPRAKDAETLARQMKQAGLQIASVAKPVKRSFQKALSDADPEDIVLVTGSAFVVAEVL